MLFLGVFMVGAPMKPNGVNDDAALIRRAKEGSMDAFEALVKRFERPIYALCRRMTGAHQSADDMAQETFIKAFYALGRFDESLPFFPWLRKIAVNASLNYLKSGRRDVPLDPARIESRRPAAEGPDPRAPAEEAPFQSRPESPEERLEKVEFEKRFEEALAALPADQKSVFVLKFYDDQSYKEIARTLHIAVGTVMSRLSRARRKLKESLT
jgi:RNA polymerase sigma-70 factor, ECF subfamily